MKIAIGTDTYRNTFAVDLDLHTAIIGQSGVGKSTVMVNSFIRLVQEGRGGVFIDPHGPAADKIVRYIPRERMNDVIYIDLRAVGVPGIIPQYKSKDEEQLFKKGVISMLYSLHKNRWGDETERIIKGALDAVTEVYGFINVPAIYLFLARDSFRTGILRKCKNPMLADFAEQYDEKLKTSEQMSRFSPPLNKWDEFVEPLMRTAMHHERSIDFRRAMDEQKILIVRLPKGEIGEEISKLAGAIIVLNIKIAALGRRESDPKFHVYIDECQNFMGSVDFETFASELRKYNVPLFLGTQYLDNFPSLSALFGNFPNIIIYRVSGTDAKILEENYLDQGLSNQLVNLPDYHFVCRYKDKGLPLASGVIKSRAKTKKLGDEPPGPAVIGESIRRYAANREKSDREILQFLTPPPREM
jgi:hypothetical protein